jgi:hypothetical protein
MLREQTRGPPAAWPPARAEGGNFPKLYTHAGRCHEHCGLCRSWRFALGERVVRIFGRREAALRHCSLLQPLMHDQPQPACDRVENNSAERAGAYHRGSQ